MDGTVRMLFEIWVLQRNITLTKSSVNMNPRWSSRGAQLVVLKQMSWVEMKHSFHIDAVIDLSYAVRKRRPEPLCLDVGHIQLKIFGPRICSNEIEQLRQCADKTTGTIFQILGYKNQVQMLEGEQRTTFMPPCLFEFHVSMKAT